MCGGRRTAAAVAAQYFKLLPGITTIYVSSSESRSLLKIDERGVSKSVLVQLPGSEVKKLADMVNITQSSFTKNYVVARNKKKFVCILNVKYNLTNHALPPADRKLRELNLETNWLTVAEEHILPKPSTLKYPPILYKMVYL